MAGAGRHSRDAAERGEQPPATAVASCLQQSSAAEPESCALCLAFAASPSVSVAVFPCRVSCCPSRVRRLSAPPSSALPPFKSELAEQRGPGVSSRGSGSHKEEGGEKRQERRNTVAHAEAGEQRPLRTLGHASRRMRRVAAIGRIGATVYSCDRQVGMAIMRQTHPTSLKRCKAENQRNKATKRY